MLKRVSYLETLSMLVESLRRVLINRFQIKVVTVGSISLSCILQFQYGPH